MVKLFSNFEYQTELLDVAKLYFADIGLTDIEPDADIVVAENSIKDGYVYNALYLNVNFHETLFLSNKEDVLQSVRLRKRFAKIALYKVLSVYFNKEMPWGSLTGIRPTKLACQLKSEGLDWKDTFKDLLGVSDAKTQLVDDILTTQGVSRIVKPNCADLYIGIPFCVSRCSYCSFTSGEIDRLKKYVEPYVDALCNDINKTIAFANAHGITLSNVYIGGGTPTSLSCTQLERVLSQIAVTPTEYTVEAGRPDTITEEKLALFKKYGVDRISINPQTFNQDVLDVIGRKHTVQDIYDKYELAKKYGFTVNMDLIAGLPSETFDMFCKSVDSAIALAPDNITVHTLALKRGSILKEQNYQTTEQDVSAMVEYSHKRLYANGYKPYYMYRQKYMAENLENVGFCKPDTQCLYNIGIMEEITNILACGTNAISKRIFSLEDRIERAANAKDVITYIERNEDYLAKKFELFEK